MAYQLRCRCGKVLLAGEGDAGSEGRCECGRGVPVPLLSELRRRRWVNDRKPTEETEGRRNLRSGVWWLAGSVAVLAAAWVFAPNLSTALLVTFWAAVGMAVGVLRLIRGIVQEKEAEG